MDGSLPLQSNRRRFLRGTGAAAVTVGVAGCLGDDDEDDDAPPEDEETPVDDDETGEDEGDDDPDDVPRGGHFEYGMTQGPVGLNPITAGDMYSWVILNLVHEPGTVVDPYENEVRPWVFTDWEVEDPDAEELDIYFDVRDGLTWTDGTEFGVDDVHFTYNFLLEQNPGELAGVLEPIESVEEADDGWDLHMALNERISVYASMQLGDVTILPRHIWEDVDDYLEYQPSEHVDEGRPVGLGAGTVTRYDPDTSVEVTFRDREEWGLGDLDWIQEHDQLRAGGPFLDAVRFQVYGSSSALHEGLLQGEIDTLYDMPEPGYIDQIEDEPRLDFVRGHDSGWNHYSFNLRHPPLDDTCFRQILGFAFDHVYWIDQLNRGVPYPGNFPIPPGYANVRPEAEEDPDLIHEHDAGKAFQFREDQPGVVDVEGIRDFLREGQVIDGTAGEYVGQEYPGSITGVEAGESEARHEYTFDEVETDVLEDAATDQEIRVNGETIPELLGRPLEMLMYPPQDSPLVTQMIENFVGQLRQIGIPIERDVMTFNTMIDVVYRDTDFDIYPMGWTNQPPFGVQTLGNLFHSREAHEEPPGDTMVWNAMGYGLDGYPGADELIDAARNELDPDARNGYVREAAEKVYLDYPTMITSFEQPLWPVNTEEFGGFLEDVPDPGSSYQTAWEFRMMYPRE